MQYAHNSSGTPTLAAADRRRAPPTDAAGSCPPALERQLVSWAGLTQTQASTRNSVNLSASAFQLVRLLPMLLLLTPSLGRLWSLLRDKFFLSLSAVSPGKAAEPFWPSAHRIAKRLRPASRILFQQ